MTKYKYNFTKMHWTLFPLDFFVLFPSHVGLYQSIRVTLCLSAALDEHMEVSHF